MADSVQTVLVLGTDITLQGLEDAVGLQNLRRVKIQLVAQRTGSHPTITLKNIYLKLSTPF